MEYFVSQIIVFPSWHNIFSDRSIVSCSIDETANSHKSNWTTMAFYKIRARICKDYEREFPSRLVNCLMYPSPFKIKSFKCRNCLISFTSCLVHKCYNQCLNKNSKTTECEQCALRHNCSLNKCTSPNFADRKQMIW